MAGDPRQPGADLTAPEEMDAFALLRRLERSGRRFGLAGGPSREPARLGQAPRLAVAMRDVARLDPGDPPRVSLEILGLLGPEGPMPLHLTRWVFERVSERWFDQGSDRATADTAFLDFCNLLQHRHMALFWRAWSDGSLAVHADRGGEGRVGATLAALAGLGLPGQRPRQGPAAEVEATLLAHASRVAVQVHAGERLVAAVSDLLGAPVRLVEFVGSWVAIPAPLQTRLGRAHAGLGQGAVAGARVFSRQDRVELRVGPLGLDAFRALADDPALRRRLRHLVLHLIGREMVVDLRPILAAAEVPAPVAGRVALGRTAWLPGAIRDRDDLRLSDLLSAREAA